MAAFKQGHDSTSQYLSLQQILIRVLATFGIKGQNESPPSEMTPQEYIELVLGGGGIKGFGHIGLLKVIEEENIAIGKVTGVSIGSLVATLYANGYSATEIEAIFLKEFGKIDPLILAKTLRWRGIRRMLKAGGFIDFSEMFKDMCQEYKLEPKENLRIIAYDVKAQKPVVFEGTDYCLHEAITASCSIPGIMRPVLYGLNCHINEEDVGHRTTQVLVDGGLHHPNPASFSDQPAIISKLGFAKQLPNRWLSPMDLLFHMVELLGSNVFEWIFEEIGPEHIVIPVSKPNVGIVTAGLTPRECRQLVDHGYKVSRKALKKAIKEGRIPVKKVEG